MDSTAPRPRLCHVRKSPDFAGYGFNLHAEKGKAGQYIGKVDAGSPADKAGLREGDRIVEVNGTNVASENHSQVVARIKAVSDEVAFLVVDSETDSYYRDNNIVITGDLDNVERIPSEVNVADEQLSSSAPVQLDPSSAENIEIPVPKMFVLDPEDRDEDDHEEHDTNTNADETETQVVIAELEAAVDTEEEQHNHASAAAIEIGAASSNGVHTDDAAVELHEHRPRLCELKTWSDFGGFGFNLHANKGETAQFIGKVDRGSPADHSGLKEGDRIIEVNGTNVEDSSHQDVVRLVKSTPGTVTLLVVDPDADKHFKGLGVIITSNLSSVERITCPDNNPATSATPGETPAEVVLEVEKVEEIAAPALLVQNPPSYVEATEPEVVATSHPYRARLCVIHSWKDGKGYGFSMQAQKGSAKSGQFIGKVDKDTPADVAALRPGDRIIEVNGSNVEKASHKEVVDKIKSVPDKVELFVVDDDADKYFNEKNIKVSSSLESCFERNESPKTKPEVAELPVTMSVATPTEATALATSHPYRARLCVIHSWKDGKGYGFSMQAQKVNAKSGQFIGKVDKDTPADAAALRPGDRIIEVNGSNVEKASHKEVVDKIKSVPDKVELLVVDDDADKYFNEKNIKVSNSTTNLFDRKESSKTKVTVEAASVEVVASTTPAAAVAVASKLPATENRISSGSGSEGNPAAATETGGSSSPPVVINGIEFASSAQDARRRMSKKKLVTDDKRSMKDKFDLFQKM